jgi:hypothetical protein
VRLRAVARRCASPFQIPARAASGPAAVAPQSRVMKSRRLMGAYPKARITEDYNRSELGRWRASQQKRSPYDRFVSCTDTASSRSHVRFTPESGHGSVMTASAFDPQRPLAGSKSRTAAVLGPGPMGCKIASLFSLLLGAFPRLLRAQSLNPRGQHSCLICPNP